MASTNGTLVNGKGMGEKAKLHHGDLIRVGDTVLLFALVEESIPVSQAD